MVKWLRYKISKGKFVWKLLSYRWIAELDRRWENFFAVVFMSM